MLHRPAEIRRSANRLSFLGGTTFPMTRQIVEGTCFTRTSNGRFPPQTHLPFLAISEKIPASFRSALSVPASGCSAHSRLSRFSFLFFRETGHVRAKSAFVVGALAVHAQSVLCHGSFKQQRRCHCIDTFHARSFRLPPRAGQRWLVAIPHTRNTEMVTS